MLRNVTEKSSKKQEKGITLIALIVTIIVLLILSGISIAMLTGDNGILNKAAEAKVQTEIASLIERVRLDIFEKQMIGSGEITNSDLQKILDTYFLGVPSELPETATELEAIELISRDGGYKIKIGEIYKGSVSSGSGTEPEEPEELIWPNVGWTKPYLPSSDFKHVKGSLETGIVIEDAIGNQYVWIEVPKITDVYQNVELEKETFTDTDYIKIEADLHAYANTYRNGTSYSDNYYQDSTEGWFANEPAYNTAKQNMLKSVYQNGGFWIGRYEAGIETNRTASGVATETPLSQENKYPYTFVTRTQAKVLAEKVNSGTYTSSLMFGIQWDLILKYIEEKEVEYGGTLATIQNELSKDSKSWGNYSNASFKLNRGRYAKNGELNTWNEYTKDLTGIVVGQEKKSVTSNSNSVLLTTGASDATKRQNIYDIAGNVSEWTLEYTNNPYGPCCYIGGQYDAGGNIFPANSRNGDSVEQNWSCYGFRVSIY